MHNLKKSYATVVCGSRHCLCVSFFSLISIALLFYPDRFTVFHSEPSHLFYLLMQIRTLERRLSTPHLKPPLTSKNKNVKDRIVWKAWHFRLIVFALLLKKSVYISIIIYLGNTKKWKSSLKCQSNFFIIIYTSVSYYWNFPFQ